MMNYNTVFFLCAVVATIIITVNGECEDCNVPKSCQDWYDLGIRKSCRYPIYPDGKTQHWVFCDMKGCNCDDEGGWTRVGYLDMTESNATCPTGLTKHIYNNIDHPLCVRSTSSLYSGGCASTTFSSLGVKYCKICGRIRGYQYKSPDGFYRYSSNLERIDTYYVDGVSITYGNSPRHHIWTYAAGHAGNPGRCPCETPSTSSNPPPPSFVGNDYYCEAGNDVLWDGKDCPGSEAPCCNNTKQPWFYRGLGSTIKDDIDLRLCDDQGYGDEAVLIDFIEIYIR